MNKLYFFMIVAVLTVSHISGQDRDVVLEQQTERTREESKIYVDSDCPDMLIHDSDTLLFRCSPMTLIPYYSTLYPWKVYIASFGGFGYEYDEETKLWEYCNSRLLKGYHVVCIIQNDSLFIRKIARVENVSDKNPQLLSEEEVNSRMEQFTNCHFRNGLLFANWVNGDFGILKEFIPQRIEEGLKFGFKDKRETGLLFIFKDGILVKQEEDLRKQKI